MARYIVTIDGKEFDIEVEYRSEQYIARVNGRDRRVARRELRRGRSLLLLDHESYEIDIRHDGGNGDRTVFMAGIDIPLHIEDYNLAQVRKTAGIGAIGAAETFLKAPMPGLVVEVKVAPGDVIKKGQPLALIEAMKMENVLKAKTDGTVKTILVEKRQSVEKGENLIEFE